MTIKKPTGKQLLFAGGALLAGLLWRSAYAPFAPQGGSVFFVLLPLFAAARFMSPKTAAKFGFWSAFVFWVTALTWFWPLVSNEGPLPIVFLGEVALSFWCALFSAPVLGGLSAVLWRPWRYLRAQAKAAHAQYLEAPEGSRAEKAALSLRKALTRKMLFLEMVSPLTAGIFWAGSEYLRSTIGGGFSWYTAGVSQISFLPLLQTAALGGVYLTGAVCVAMSDAFAGVAVRICDTLRHTPGTNRRHLDLTVALVLCMGAVCWGTARIQKTEQLFRAAPHQLLLAAAQPNLPCIFEADSAAANKAYAELWQQTVFAAECEVDAVVWPETILWAAMPDETMRKFLLEQARKSRFCILAGGTDAEGSLRTEVQDGMEYATFTGPVSNGSWLFSWEPGEGAVQGPYRKRHLIPFGEYFPLDEKIPFLQRLVPSGITCRAGTEATVFLVPSKEKRTARVAPLICFEDTVSPVVRESAKKCDILVSQSNDAWFEGSYEPVQHHREALVRAVEYGRPFVRSSNAGISSYISPVGRTEVIAEKATQGVALAAVPLPEVPLETPYLRYGDLLFGIPCAIILLLACGITWFRLQCHHENLPSN